ncbi:unnamed protein product [Hydatigera taeniaeformis]|uniref:Rap-GAP domain-containing protein n=1 Tax=Hydatigena taeniaeformis TaxID=6205 RepID=A0A0R3XAG0_HYDTA|nr:unnamed protein product [Hydatigera taeniaeformis]
MFARRRLQKLMEEEVYRNSALALVNMNVGHPPPNGQSHIPDVCLDSWEQYKAYVWLFTQIGVGIRQSCRPLITTFIDSRGDVVSATGLAQALRDLFTSQAERDRVSHGGVCSSFCLLEMAHTHYHLLPKRRSVVTQSSTTPRRVTSASNATSLPTSPKQLVEPLTSPKFKSDSYVGDKGFFTFFTDSPSNPTTFEPLHQHEQDAANQSSFHYLRDMPDLIELSQKLQTRLAEAFRSSGANTSPDNNGERKETCGSRVKAYLSKEAALRLSHRLLASQTVPTLGQKSTRSRSHRTHLFFLLHSSHILHDGDDDDDDISEMTSTSWNGQHRSQRVNTISEAKKKERDEKRKLFNVINTERSTPSQPLSPIKQRRTFGRDSEEEEAKEVEFELTASSAISMNVVEDVVTLPSFKSSVSLGYRYRHGRLFQTTTQVSPSVKTPPPCISVPALRFGLADQKSNSTATSSSIPESNKAADNTKATTKKGEEVTQVKLQEDEEVMQSKVQRTYLFEEAMINATDSKLWTNMQFWEDLFLDTVVQERGMDFDPEGLLEHYAHLTPIGQKHLELNEDDLLAGVMHNLIAFMRGNDIDLLPMASRQFTPETFFVYPVWLEEAEMCAMEVGVSSQVAIGDE